MVCSKPVRLIETSTFKDTWLKMRSYGTFNGNFGKITKPVRLIEPVLIIEIIEYLAKAQMKFY